MKQSSLPRFRRPPVIETVLGVQFKHVPGFTNGHLGAFWKYFQSVDAAARPPGAWGTTLDHPSIPPVFETFEDSAGWIELGTKLTISQDFGMMLRIRNETGDRMIQVQNGRLHYNWLGEGGSKYPRYAIVRPEFDQVFRLFQNFLGLESLSPIQPNQWEVTYVNHMPRGTVWESPADWNELFRHLPGVISKSPVVLESLNGSWHFEIPPRKGRLHIDLRNGRTHGGQELLVLKLTARGPIQEADWASGIELGRATIVETFALITSEAAHRVWEREG